MFSEMEHRTSRQFSYVQLKLAPAPTQALVEFLGAPVAFHVRRFSAELTKSGYTTMASDEALAAKKIVLEYLRVGTSDKIDAIAALSCCETMKVGSANPSHALANLLDLKSRAFAKAQGGDCPESLTALREAVECGLRSGSGAMQGQKKKAQVKREGRLREMEVCMGLVNVEEEVRVSESKGD